jgi:hypothetical protein
MISFASRNCDRQFINTYDQRIATIATEWDLEALNARQEFAIIRLSTGLDKLDPKYLKRTTNYQKPRKLKNYGHFK